MKYIFTFTFCLVCIIAYPQKYFTLNGYIKDKQTGEVLIGAMVSENSLSKGAITNGYGYYSLTLPEGRHNIVSSYLGYDKYNFEILLEEDSFKDIELNPSYTALEQVMVEANPNINSVNPNVFNAESFSIKEINQLPRTFGEPDVIKALQLQSGVKTIGEASSALFVRGSGSDQNLILIDEAPIYNPSHLFGLVSIFNTDAINHITFYKSNMPAQYGGRVGAVLDCKMKEGNFKKLSHSVSLSPLSVGLSTNGPIIKEKATFFFSARKSLIDLMASPGKTLPLVPSFYDMNFKINTKIGPRNRLFFSIYNGEDKLKSADGFFNKWGNNTATIRWNTNIGTKFFSKISVIKSDYKNYLEFTEGRKNYKWLTGINDINAKADISFFLKPNNVFEFGFGSIYHTFIPGETAQAFESIHRIQAYEHSAYILNDLNINSWLGLNYGLRLSVFQNTGKAQWYEYGENYRVKGQRTNNNGVYNTYWTPEPRINLNFTVHPGYSFKIAYARNSQYMQVLQNNSLSYSSVETWFPANANIKPITSNTFSWGWFQNISNKISFSVESYYKENQNQIDYVDHARLINNPFIEGEIRKGKAYAFGTEFLIKMKSEKFTGNFSYTYSRAFRLIEGLNNNMKYSSPFDIPHDIKTIGIYQITRKWNVSSAWVYMTGRPLTLPVGFFIENKDPVPIYSGRNTSRFPDYHRLDITANYTTKTSSGMPFLTLGFGLYNAYARKNPLGYEFSRRTNSAEGVDVYQFSLFTIMPNFSIQYNF
jgi:hypothetical protein